ncbi:hypothetical protein [Bacillus paranthracis]|uniref:Uncharacterized protein n=1 Tax=Bacillus paranthracis TaxID=2026186 RepID=A0AAJ1KCE2_9BACI|nr:hypothetical protein [Bacillus paranthracis]MDG0947879.1 hypothetical protein [Bacillus paranthracis]MDG0953680.1 hypothetical protein [Bacillus paranthracis]
MVQICPMCNKETVDPNNEEIYVDFCNECETKIIFDGTGREA